MAHYYYNPLINFGANLWALHAEIPVRAEQKELKSKDNPLNFTRLDCWNRSKTALWIKQPGPLQKHSNAENKSKKQNKKG